MFEGKEIVYITESNIKINAIVVACVKDVGITIVAKADKEQILYCLRMKNAPNFIKAKGNITLTRKMFTCARKLIISGKFNAKKLYNPDASDTYYISHSSCAFNQ